MTWLARFSSLVLAAAWPAAAPAQEGAGMTARDLASVVDVGGYTGVISVSPDGARVALLEQRPNLAEDDFDQTWVVVSVAGDAAPIRAADGGPVILNYRQRAKINGAKPDIEAKWSPDGAWFAYPKITDGVVQLWRTSRDGGVTEQLTFGSRSVVSSDGNEATFLWSDDGSKLFYRLGRDMTAAAALRAREGRRGYLFDERYSAGYREVPAFRRCEGNRYGQVSPEREACTIDTWIVDPATGAARAATPAEDDWYRKRREELGVFRIYPSLGAGVRIRLRQNDRLAAWIENEDPERYTGMAPLVRLAARPAGADHAIRCPHEACRGHYRRSPSDLWVFDDAVLFLRRQGHNRSVTALYAWAPGANKLRTVLETDDKLYGCALANGELVCLHEGWTSPRKIVAVNVQTGALRTVHDPNPQTRDRVFTNVEKLEFEDRFGNPAHGHLVYPRGYKAGKRYPLVIVQYRSNGFLRGGVGDEYPIHPLAEAGFLVLSFDRPSSLQRLEKTKDILDETSDQFFYDRDQALSALHNVVDPLVERGLVDADRIGLTGLSDGVSTVAYALVHSADRFATVIGSAGFVGHPTSYFLSTAWGRRYRRGLLGHPSTSIDKWRRLTPADQVGDIDVPVLVHAAYHEFLGGIVTHAVLEDAGKAIEMHVFPDAHHIKWRPAQRLNIYRRNIQWMKFWLNGEAVDDPVDPDQYARWATLCRLHVDNLKAADDPAKRTRADHQRCARVAVN